MDLGLGIPGDGRCLFRSVVHGACLRAGKPSPSEACERELADELRAKVTDEFIKRRADTEWFVEGDFDTYVMQMRLPHIWGGEPELLMSSHVLQVPITVHMLDKKRNCLKVIAEYGQEYGKENPVRVLYHGYGHYDALQNQCKESVRLLVLWVLPCFFLKTACEVIRMLYIIHFDDYGKLLERQSDVLVLTQEHIRLRHYLSKLSHRFRIYLILVFLIVTVCQFVTLFQATGYTGMITFINEGDFAVSSIVQVAGITLCLNAAAKISHRAQGIGSLASQWHALRTCTPTDASQLRLSSSSGSLEVDNVIGSLYINYSESDLESLDFVPTSRSTPLASYSSTYHKRQALDHSFHLKVSDYMLHHLQEIGTDPDTARQYIEIGMQGFM